MEIYEVLYYPHALLKKNCSPVTKFTDQFREFLKNLIATAYEFHGGGIAAPQVGVSKRVFVCDFESIFQDKESIPKEPDDFLVFDDKGNSMEIKFPMIFVNPEILETEKPISTDWEGCLSFPDAPSFEISRFHKITVRAQNEFGEFFTVKTRHLYAAVNFQHEIDHLNGITMINHWPKKDYIEKDIVGFIQDFIENPEHRKKIKKLKLVKATKIKFDFL